MCMSFWLVLPVLFHASVELTTEETMKLFARLAAQTVICLGWDWLSSPSHYNLLFQRADKKPKTKYKIPYYSKNQTKRYCIVPRVAFAARTVRHKRSRERSRTHRRRTQIIRSRRTYFWSKGHTNRTKTKKAQTRLTPSLPCLYYSHGYHAGFHNKVAQKNQ